MRIAVRIFRPGRLMLLVWRSWRIPWDAGAGAEESLRGLRRLGRFLPGRLLRVSRRLAVIDLNRAVGGVNPAAVERMARVQGGYGRVVWMPTFDSENEVSAVEAGSAVCVRVAWW